ncbi:tripartite tricarboxylate transporter substrate binding protein [Variovorax boronicumulans]|uniref:tripartite tricarboxylate transporter substrate binding protein n=1 Tax=Variovorax boronicumulans TaxID=436515 RepID=UPI00214BBBA8
MRKIIQGLLAAMLFSSAAQTLMAEEKYPARPVTVMVGFAAGGGTDQMARMYAKKLGDRLGKSFVTLNREGAGGNIAIQTLAKSPADGYTLALGSDYIASNVALKRNPYDWQAELAPIAAIAQLPNVIIVPPDSKINTVKELIDAARQPGAHLTYGSAGVGSSQHLSGEMFNAMAGTKLVHVPYRGAALAESDLMAGQTDLMFDSVATAIGLAKGGRVKVIAVTSLKRHPELPNVPTVDESGLRGFDVSPGYYFLAPAKTPKPVVSDLSAAVLSISKDPEVQKFMATLNTLPLHLDAAQTGAHMKSEVEKWGKIVESSGLKVD